MTTPASHRRVLAASLVGTAVEFYDFYIYATAAALVFGPLFFPSEEPGLQLLAKINHYHCVLIVIVRNKLWHKRTPVEMRYFIKNQSNCGVFLQLQR